MGVKLGKESERRERERMYVFENWVLRKIFWRTREEES
jgi:hypothetical protein